MHRHDKGLSEDRKDNPRIVNRTSVRHHGKVSIRGTTDFGAVGPLFFSPREDSVILKSDFRKVKISDLRASVFS